ncbi:MAG: molybdate ABC transporter substrate-binding protein [Spirochaetia bacterium]|jgi:molybdate transport system substrate-binding protein|nr:molybdate ABC transporter substrate-binding protein [Spirochaetia bacterium]
MAAQKKHILIISIILIVSISLTVIATTNEVKPNRNVVFISAASSLTEAIGDIINIFRESHPEVLIRVSFGGSGYLTTQIVNGAPIDILITADERDADRLILQNFATPESKSILCRNKLVLAGMGGQSTDFTYQDLDKKLKNGSKVGMGNPDYVAAGLYTKALLSKSGLLNNFSSDFIKGNSVRQVVGWLESGDVDYAFIYKTDVKLNPEITILEEYNSFDGLKITYPMLITIKGETNPEADLFMKYLNSSRSRSILNKYGFITDRI